MLRTMLVGLDGSTHSRVATELGIDWARRYDALLVGLGVVDEPTIRQSVMAPIGASEYKKLSEEALMHDARRKVEAILEQFSIRCAEAGVASKVLEDAGMPAKAIAREAQRYDLVILGQQTNFHFETQATADNTLAELLRLGPRPVVTVPAELVPGKAVVVAYDGSVQAARTLQVFVANGLSGLDDLHVVCVDDDRLRAAKTADLAMDFLRNHEVAATAHAVVTHDAPGAVLLDEATRLKARLLVMGACGQPRLREFFFGSTTQYALKHSPVPLFLCH